MEKLAIVGIFFDGYYDLWEDFLELYEKFCKNSDYPLYIVNNSAELNYEKKYNVQVLHAGEDAEYSRKVQMALESIDAEKYLLLLEDFFFTNNFPNEEIESILHFMDDNQIEYYKMPLPEFAKRYKKSRHSQYESLKQIDANSEYTVTCQPSIWNREFLEQCIGKSNYNAWVFEGIYCKSRWAHEETFRNRCIVDTRNILGLAHGAVQGKMLPDTVNLLKALGYQMKNEREILSGKDFNKHRRKQLIKQLLPLSLQKRIKVSIKTTSVIERYSEEIAKEMKNMGIE